MYTQELTKLTQNLETMLNFTNQLESDGSSFTPDWVTCFKVTAQEAATIFIGVPAFKTSQGVVLVFKKTGDMWRTAGTVVPMDLTPGAYFGNSLSVTDDGSTLVVGAEMSSEAYVFQNSKGIWVEEAKLHIQDINPRDAFANTVAISKGKGARTVIVGAPYSTVKGCSDAGAAYCFTSTGEQWVLDDKLEYHTPETGMKFGSSVKYSLDLPGWLIQSKFGIHHMVCRNEVFEEIWLARSAHVALFTTVKNWSQILGVSRTK